MTRIFDTYAHYYDLLYRDKDYAGEAAYVNSFIRKHSPKASQILELGCGTGGHAVQFAQMGYAVHGVDLSSSMLTRANERKAALAPDISNRLSFDEGDARTLRTGKTYDVVLALFHVMSYQTSNSDLHAAFETAFEHLAPGGVFLFDFWYGPAVLTEKPEVRLKRLEDEKIKVFRVAEPVLTASDSTVDVNYTMFVHDKKGGQIEQFSESHKMRYFFLSEMENYLTGRFSHPGFFEWMTEHPLSTSTWSGFTCALRA
jgi:SAM-dependent methyltransferase